MKWTMKQQQYEGNGTNSAVLSASASMAMTWGVARRERNTCGRWQWQAEVGRPIALPDASQGHE